MYKKCLFQFVSKCCLLTLFLNQIVFVKTQKCFDAHMRPGNCKLLSECPNIRDYFCDGPNKYSCGTKFKTFVSNSLCEFDGFEFKICCRTNTTTTTTTTHPPMEILQSTYKDGLYGGYVNYFKSTILKHFTSTTPLILQPIPTTRTTDRSLISQPVQQETLNGPNCGLNRGILTRVVGGQEAFRGNYPWMAALFSHSNRNPKYFYFSCAGSLISPKYVITAAHCIKNRLAQVRLGAHNLTDNNEFESKTYSIKRTIQHEHYDKKHFIHDVALIELNETVTMTKYINTICLPEDPKFLTNQFVGMNPFLAGYGAPRYRGKSVKVLKDVQVPLLDIGECEKKYRQLRLENMKEKSICAGSSTADACQGDSGGPLMMPQLLGDQYHYYLLGVISYGYGCARPGFPGVYVKVASYIPWIKSNII